MKSDNLLTTKEISTFFEISGATLSRWVARGCPHRVEQNRCLFILDEVETWIHENSDPALQSLRLESCRKLKHYWVFRPCGTFHGVVLGSKKLIELLKSFRKYHHHYPFGVDDAGYVYFFYSGKLRSHESVKTGAGVLIHSRYPETLEPLMDIVRNRYLNRNNKREKNHLSI